MTTRLLLAWLLSAASSGCSKQCGARAGNEREGGTTQSSDQLATDDGGQRFWPPALDAHFSDEQGERRLKLLAINEAKAVIIAHEDSYEARASLPATEWHILDLSGPQLQHVRVSASSQTCSATAVPSAAARAPLRVQFHGDGFHVHRVVWWDGDRPKVDQFDTLQREEGLDGSLVFVDPENYEPGSLDEGCPGREPSVPVTLYPAQGGRLRSTIPRPTAWTALPERSLLMYESCERLYRVKLPDGAVELLSEQIEGEGTTRIRRAHGTDIVEVGRYSEGRSQASQLWHLGLEPPQPLLSRVFERIELTNDALLLTSRSDQHELWTIREGRASFQKTFGTTRASLRGQSLQVDDAVEDLQSGQVSRLPSRGSELSLARKVGRVWLVHERYEGGHPGHREARLRLLVWNPTLGTVHEAQKPPTARSHGGWTLSRAIGEHVLAAMAGGGVLLYRPEDNVRLTVIARSAWGMAVAPDGRVQLLYGAREAAAAEFRELAIPGRLDAQPPLLQRMLEGDPL